MAPANPLIRYPAPARKYAFIKALDAGFTPQDTVKNPACVRLMIEKADLYLAAQKPLPGLEVAPVSPTKPASKPVPTDTPSPPESLFKAISSVGALRGLYVVLDGMGRYAVTLKITHPTRGSVYRFGRVPHERDIEPLIRLWLAKGEWTPDKLK